MSKHSASYITDPTGLLGAGGGSSIKTLEQDWVPEMEVHPAVDAVNGPITADSGVVSGDLSAPAGQRFIPWDAVDQYGQPIFNYQGMVPSYAPANIQTAAGRTCLLNAFTPRWFNGTTGQYYNGVQSIRVGIASINVTPVWYTAQGQLSATNVDMHIMVEHQGKNKHLSSAPTATDGLPVVGGGGSGTYHRSLAHVDHRYKEHRFILGPNCYFLGCWVDTISNIQRPKNRPQLFVTGIDSWQDPQTVVGNGTGWTGRDYQCLPQCIVASFRTGMCWGTDGQGGTGEYNANGTTGGGADTYTGNRSSAAWSDSRVDWRANWWSSQFPIWVDIGGWNDGSSMVSPYQSTYRTRVAARVQKTIDRINALGRDTRFVNIGIQPVDVTATTDNKYLAALGQQEVPGLFPGVVIGHAPLMPMWWQDTTSTGPRSLYCNNSDHIHLLAVGDNAVVGYYCDYMGKFQVDTAYLNEIANANVPVVTVPTS